MISKIKNHILAILILSITAVLLCYFAYFNEFSEGGADNCWHYYFSKYAITYPEYFLHHWGKPIFILLSTAFAQFGFYGLQIFNILCGLSAAIIVYKFTGALNIKYRWYSIILLLFTPLYFLILQSGMTEPLMSLILVASMYLLFKENFFYAALLMSFSMYARTEGTFLTLYVLMYLALLRQWKYIPLLGVGFIIYSVIGICAGREFLWFFTENPYNAISPYGHGELSDFFKRYNIIWGLPQTILLSISLILILVIGLVKIKQLKFTKLIPEHKFLLVVVAPAIILFMFHVIVWKYGWCGSCGLERVIACVSPLFVLIVCYGINFLISEKLPAKYALPLIFVFLFFVIESAFKPLGYPLKAYGGDKVELKTAKWFKSNYDQNCVVYYAHPGIVFNCDRNPFDKKLNMEQFGLNVDNLTDKSLPTFIFWDSQFSESSCGLKLDTLLNSPKVKLIYHPEEDYGFNMYVFELLR